MQGFHLESGKEFNTTLCFPQSNVGENNLRAAKITNKKILPGRKKERKKKLIFFFYHKNPIVSWWTGRLNANSVNWCTAVNIPQTVPRLLSFIVPILLYLWFLGLIRTKASRAKLSRMPHVQKSEPQKICMSSKLTSKHLKWCSLKLKNNWWMSVLSLFNTTALQQVHPFKKTSSHPALHTTQLILSLLSKPKVMLLWSGNKMKR